jgi:uncharacterized protein YecA (UPF0149 family)
MKIIVRNAPCPCGSSKKYKRCHGVEMPKASLRKSEAVVPSVFKPFPPHGISPWVAEAMKRASRQ